MKPIKIKRVEQPHTIETWIIESASPLIANADSPDYIKSRASKGWIQVTGRVVNSKTTNRLFNHSLTVENPDRPLSDSLPPEYVIEGATYITVCM